MIERQQGNLRYQQFNHYLQFPELTHSIFTRQGGYSEGQYRALNTSTTLKAGDSIDNVSRNRQLALQTLNLAHYPCVTSWQIHGANVATFDTRDEWRSDWAYPSYYYQSWTPQSIHKADAIITRERGVAIALSFADCTPIMLYDPVEQVIGIAHGGWRGTARGIAAITVAAMERQFGCQPQNIYAGIGPSIGACCYEVSQDVQDLFMGRLSFEDMPTHPHYQELVRESAAFSTKCLPDRESLRLDLWATNRKQLLLMGLLPTHIEVTDTCTCCNTDRFFSHRGERGKTGRFPVIMALSA
ncbi:MAG TPA: peptidoglycan editing factor PgeF [Ktedonosporobacter sp.]|nr:peptidoglycan editing factor PgeF [Ktedonosporobacter sp.]